jgi:hypothetical protein
VHVKDREIFMASFRDNVPLDICLTEDSRAFVFEWVAAPIQKRDQLRWCDTAARIEDILDDIQEDASHEPFCIRFRP